MKRPRFWSVLAVLSFFPFCSEALAGVCACNADVNDNGSINTIDGGTVFTCAGGGTCGGCVNSCDVDCSGEVDFTDFSMVYCQQLGGGPACCEMETGACSGLPANHNGGCADYHEAVCAQYEGTTYHGDNTSCINGQPVEIPAASAWGLTALGILLLIAATLTLRPAMGAHPYPR